jgi:hypothetical protein
VDCWHREIERSGTEDEVVANARDFLVLWSARELAPLTMGWRDIAIDNADDIDRMKRWIVEDLAPASETSRLSDLGDYLWHADRRIRELRTHHAAGSTR